MALLPRPTHGKHQRIFFYVSQRLGRIAREMVKPGAYLEKGWDGEAHTSASVGREDMRSHAEEDKDWDALDSIDVGGQACQDHWRH